MPLNLQPGLALRLWLTLTDPFLQSHRKQIVDFAAKNRLPSIHPDSEYVEAGGLMSYAANAVEFYARAATYVDKILKGAKPADSRWSSPRSSNRDQSERRQSRSESPSHRSA